MPRFLYTKKHHESVEREKIAKLEQAESDLLTLRARASRAMGLLDERQRRNHWREAIEQMIQGVT